jgi:hypothetical protein
MTKTYSFILLLILNIAFSEIMVSHHKIYFTEISDADLNRGYVEADFNYISPFEVEVNSDYQWTLSIKADDFFIQSNEFKFSINKIKWKLANQSFNDYRPLTLENFPIISSNSPNQHVNLQFIMEVHWNTPPGQYSLPITFSLKENYIKKNKRKHYKIKGF